MANMGLLCRRQFYLLRHKYKFTQLRYVSVTGNPTIDRSLDTLSRGKIEGWLRAYENLVGLTEVRTAQSKVIEAEQLFLDVQAQRRKRQVAISEVHSKLKDLHAQLDKVQRGDKRYLDLLTEEYQIIKEEKNLESELNNFEVLERDHFASLSSAVRESHEKERARTERTKYWSVMGSIIGVTLGIIGTSINNYLRMRELKGIVKGSAEGGNELKGLVGQLSDTMKNQHNQLHAFVTDLKKLIGDSGSDTGKAVAITNQLGSSEESAPGQLEQRTNEILGLIKTQEAALAQEMTDIKRMLASARASDTDGNVVYVGPEMESLLQKSESSLEWKIKSNALWTITFIYGAFALTLPVLYSIFRSS